MKKESKSRIIKKEEKKKKCYAKIEDPTKKEGKKIWNKFL